MTPRCRTCGTELIPAFEDDDGGAASSGPAVRHTGTHRRSVWKCPYCDGLLDAARREYEALLAAIDAILKGRGEG